MKEIEKLSSLRDINTIYTNFRAEVFAACLVESGYDIDRVVLSRKDFNSSGFLREIEAVSVKYPNSDPDKSYLNIQTGCRGIYDTIPEGIFYVSSPTAHAKSKERILENMAIHRTEEFYIRRALSIYEVEIDRVLIEIQLMELRHDKRSTYNNFTRNFTPYWDVLGVMTNDQALRFLMIVPHIHQIRSSYSEISRALSFVLEIDIHVYVRGYKYGAASALDSKRMYQMRLGENSMLSNLTNQSPIMIVVVSELTSLQIAPYLQGGLERKVLDELLPLLAGCDMEYEITLDACNDSRSNALGIMELSQATYLGINTYL